MRKKKKINKEIIEVDRGPPEKLKHSEYEEGETIVAGVKVLINTTVDPISTYLKRNQIDDRQYYAAEHFARKYRKAKLAAAYAKMRFGEATSVSSIEDSALERIHAAKVHVRAALTHVGYPLAGVLEHVVGDNEMAGTWSGVKSAARPHQAGMIALRLALDGLVQFYKM